MTTRECELVWDWHYTVTDNATGQVLDEWYTYTWVCGWASGGSQIPVSFDAKGGGYTSGADAPTQGGLGDLKCVSAIADLALTVVSDALFVMGVGAAIKASMLAGRMMGHVARYGSRQMISAMRNAHAVARVARMQRGIALAGAGAAYLGGNADNGSASPGRAELAENGWDFVPVVASIRAGVRVVNAC